MRKYNLSGTSFFKTLSPKMIEILFIKFGELTPGSFTIKQDFFTGGTSSLNFIYPTDFTEEDAEQFVSGIIDTLGDIDLNHLALYYFKGVKNNE